MAQHWTEGVSPLRFTSREFQQELVEEALKHNLLTCPPSSAASFVALKLIQELAYQIRRPSRKKTIVLSSIHRIKAMACEISHLSDLQAISFVTIDDSKQLGDALTDCEVLVCTSEVLDHLFSENLLDMAMLNLLVIEDCHMVTVDKNLQNIMSRYLNAKSELIDQHELPRILAFTHPLFSNCEVKNFCNTVFNIKNVIEEYSENMPLDRATFIANKLNKSEDNDQSVDCLKSFTDLVCLESDKEVMDMNSFQYWHMPCCEIPTVDVIPEISVDCIDAQPSVCNTSIDNNQKLNDERTIYDKLEYQLEKLENMLCCQVDMASDIVGLKRITGKPREMIIECKEMPEEEKVSDRIQLEKFMKSTIAGALIFLEDHRYDPTEIYGDEAFGEELRAIPDPRTEPREMLELFLYILDEAGPYAADKAAFSLLVKIEKLKIKIPYERHFLLLCLVTSTFIQVRAAADLTFNKYLTEKEKIINFSTPKICRLFDILKLYKPPDTLHSFNENSPKHYSNKYNYATKEQKEIKTARTEVKNANDKKDLKTKGKTVNGKNIHTDKNENNVPEKSIPNVVSIEAINNELADEDLESKPHSIDNTNKDSIVDEKDDNLTNHNAESPVPEPLYLDESCKEKCDENVSTKTKLDLTSSENLNDNSLNNVSDIKNCKDVDKLKNALQQIDECDFLSLENKIQMNCDNLLESKSIDNKNILNNLQIFLEQPETKDENEKSYNESNKKNNTDRQSQERSGSTYNIRDNFKMNIKGSPIRKIGDGNFRGRGRGRGGKGYGFQSRYYHSVNNDPDALCGLIFVDEPLIAKILSSIINDFCRNDDDLRFVCSQYTIGKVADPLTDPKEAENEHKLQEDVLKRFRIHECNLLVGTSILEEGMDLPKCNLVIRWDPPNGYRSYARCRARARAPRSLYVILVPSPPETNITMLAHFSHVERMLIRKCGWCEPPVSEEADAGRFSGLIEPYRPADSAVSLSTSVALLNRYCVKLPSDTFTRLVPLWTMESLSYKTNTLYICTIRLPINCPLKHHIVGHPMPNRVLARRVAALQACRALHKSGELDDNLMPIGKEGFRATESDWLSLPPPSDLPKSILPLQGDIKDQLQLNMMDSQSQLDISNHFEPRPGTTKRKQYYYKKVANAFSDCRPSVGKPCLAYQISAWLACPLPERHNTRGRKLHPPEVYAEGFAILTSKPIQQIPVFPIFTRSGEVRVALEKLPFNVMISHRRKRLIHYFMKYTFSEVLRVHNHLMVFDESGKQKRNSYYIVPTLKVTDSDGKTSVIIDWNFLQLIYDQTGSENITVSPNKNFINMPSELDISNNAKISEIIENVSDNMNNDLELNNCNETNIINTHVNIVKSAILNEECDKVKNLDLKNHNSDTVNIEKDFQKNNAIVASTDNENSVVVNGHNGLENGDEIIINNKKEQVKTISNGTLVEIEDKKCDEELLSNNVILNGKEENSTEVIEGTPEGDSVVTDNDNIEEILPNPYLSPGETFEFDSEKYRDAVVMPWYRNQDQPQYFYVAEICWHLSPCSAFPSEQHDTFEEYYKHKYGVRISQTRQPLLDVDHTSARLNLLTPRFVNRKGVALPTSSERTKRAKRESLEQKQILVPELCCTHPFRGALWRAAVALPCILYRINSLLLADEIRRSVAQRVALGVSKLESDFKWPALDFGWSLAEVLAGENTKETKGDNSQEQNESKIEKDVDDVENDDKLLTEKVASTEKSANDILKEKEDADDGLNDGVFEIGMWSNDMASAVSSVDVVSQDYEDDELISATSKLPGNLTICTSIGGGADWSLSGKSPSPIPKVANRAPQQRKYSMADSDASYISSEFGMSDDMSDSSDSDNNDYNGVVDSLDTLSEKGGIRIEFKSGNEAEAIEIVPSSTNLKKITEIVIDPEVQKLEEENSVSVFQKFFYSQEDEDDETLEHIDEFKKSIDKNKTFLKNNGIVIHHNANIDHLKLQIPTEITNNQETSVTPAIDSVESNNCIQSDLNILSTENDTLKTEEDNKKNDSEISDILSKEESKSVNFPTSLDVQNSKEIMDDDVVLKDHLDGNVKSNNSTVKNDIISNDVNSETKTSEISEDLNKFKDLKVESTNRVKSLKKDNFVNDMCPFPIQGDSALSKDEILKLYREMFPYMDINGDEEWLNSGLLNNGSVTLENLEKNKRVILNEIKKTMSPEEWSKFNFFSMKDLDEENFGSDFPKQQIKMENTEKTDCSSDIDVDSKISNDPNAKVEDKTTQFAFSFDHQPDLNNHPGPSPSLILQALTMSNANDGINLERLETIGDSFLKYAITTYLYCTYQNIHEGKLSHLRSKQVSNLNLYRLGRRKSLGSRMVAYKFEPHDNWLPPCHRVPPHLERALIDTNIPSTLWNIVDMPPLTGLSKEEIEKLVKEKVASYHLSPAKLCQPFGKKLKEDQNCPLHRKEVEKGDLKMITCEAENESDKNMALNKDLTCFIKDGLKCTCTLLPCNYLKKDVDKDNSMIESKEGEYVELEGIPCFVPYNLITQHSIPDKSVADCVEALIGAYLIECGPRGALLFMAWLGIRVLPKEEINLSSDHPFVKLIEQAKLTKSKKSVNNTEIDLVEGPIDEDNLCDEEAYSIECSNQNDFELDPYDNQDENSDFEDDHDDWNWDGRIPGSLKPEKNSQGQWTQVVYGELKPPPSPLLRYVPDPEGELMQMLSGYEGLEKTLGYRFKDRCYLLQAMTHASYSPNRLTDCYQRLEFLGDAVLDYLITRQLYEDPRRHSPGALTDLRSALVNNTIFASLAVRHGMHKYFRHLSPGLNEVLARFVKIQEENGHSISEEHYLIQEDECEQAEDVEVPKALGDLFESVAGAIFLDSGMSLDAVWKVYHALMQREIEAFSESVPKSPVRELLEMEPETAKFGKPEKLADGRRVRVTVEVLGAGAFKGVGRNYRIAKCTAAKCALRRLAPSGTRRK